MYRESELRTDLGEASLGEDYWQVLLQEGEDATALQEKMKDMYNRYMATIFESIGITIEYELMKVTDIHLRSDSGMEPRPTGSIATRTAVVGRRVLALVQQG